ncbi:dTMP kinase [Candidatus Dependentiae bacterium]|nr:dTMP kinase [Candidatus Dependentiae bacterium]
MITKLKRGLLVAIEGIDGSGKSTLARTLAEQFEGQNITTILTREPGGSQLGKSLRTILQHQEKPLSPIAEFLLFAADRAQHFKEVVVPALNEKKLVISDRLSDSSLVYQGFGKGVDRTMIAQVNEWAMQSIKPDLVIYVRIDAQTARERLLARGKKLTSFEKEASEFTQRLIDGFETLYANTKNVIIVDGTFSPHELATFTFNQINVWLTSNHRITDSAKF